MGTAQLSEVLKVGQVRLMKAKLTNVFKSLHHLFHFPGRQEVNGVPVPLVVDDAVVQPDGPIGGDQVIWKHALTSGWYMELLGTLLQMHFGGCPVPAPDVNCGVSGQVSDEVTLAKLIDSLLDGNDFEGAQGLGGLELLHVQGTEASVVESLGHDSKGVTHEDLVYPVA